MKLFDKLIRNTWTFRMFAGMTASEFDLFQIRGHFLDHFYEDWGRPD